MFNLKVFDNYTYIVSQCIIFEHHIILNKNGLYSHIDGCFTQKLTF